jgi:hypothetical protein
MKKYFALLALLLASLACNFGATAPAPAPTQDVDAIVSATLTAVAANADPAPPAETPAVAAAETGSISGRLGYPAGAMPPLRVVAFDINSDAFYYVETSMNQMEYQIDGLPAGQYYVVAYTFDAASGFPSGFSGGFTAAVGCGLRVDCTDHTLLPVDVTAGSITVEIDPKDWYLDETSTPFPPDPVK